MDPAIAYLGLIDDEDIALDEAALELAALDHPGVALDAPLDLIGAMAERLAEVGAAAPTANDRAAALARVIGGEYGFAGDRDSYDDPANADLIRVIERRRGLPVALAILYVGLARRLGWEAHALDVPGHVVVRVGGERPVLIDPFNGGLAIEAADMERLAARLGCAAPIVAMGNRGTLARLLRNQAMRAERGGDAARALVLYARITAIAPDDAGCWWHRARLELAAGGVEPARASLGALLEVTRDPDVRARANDALAALAGA